MKKFMTAIFACVCASVGFAEKDTFEDKTEGAAFTTSGNWVVAAGTDATIAKDTGNANRNMYLSIADAETHESIYRAYNIPSGSSAPEATTIPATGLYFDSYVKFTVSDTLSLSEIDDTKAKIAVYAYCNDDAEPLVTNLVACAGYYDTTAQKVVTTNYVLTSTNINADAWYRLTIKTFKFSDETGVGRYGFVVYLDGTPLSYAEGVTTGYTDFTATAQKYANNRQLLPSLQDGDQTVKQTITKTSFIGTGSVDDVDWTATTPDGIPSDDILITLKWDDGISALTFGGETITVSDPTKTTNIVVVADSENKEITATLNDGYAFNTWTNGTYSVKEAKTFDLTTYAINFKVDGTPYKNLKDAVAAAIKEGKTLTLTKNLAEGTDVIDAQADGEKKTLIIDLAGHNITCSDTCDAAILLTGCDLVVTNSSTTVGSIAAGNGTSVCEQSEGTSAVTVYANCKFEGAITLNEGCTTTCYGGQFKKDDAVTAFPYTCADGYKATSGADGYWKVEAGEEKKDSPVDPGSTTECETKDKADALAKEINDAKETMINAPTELTDETQKKAYCDLFCATVIGDATAGYSVVVDFTESTSNTLQTAVNEVETKVNLPALATADQKASVEDAKPGLWYTVYMGNETPATLAPKSSTQATANTIELTFPKSTTGTRGFYRVGVSIKEVKTTSEAAAQ